MRHSKDWPSMSEIGSSTDLKIPKTHFRSTPGEGMPVNGSFAPKAVFRRSHGRTSRIRACDPCADQKSDTCAGQFNGWP